MLTVQCPGCGRQQRTQPRKTIRASVKRCVYCGRSFKIHKHAHDTRIISDAGRLPDWRSAEERLQ